MEQNPLQAARAAKLMLRNKSPRRFYIYRGESFRFTFAGETRESLVCHGDTIALSEADVSVFRKIGREIADSESKEDRKSIKVPTTGDLVADLESVERSIVEDDYTTAAKLARMLKLDLENEKKETVFSGLLDWLDTQRG